MDKFVVRGGNPLLGTIKVSGAKNSALPCMAAAILTEDEVILENIPQVRDIETERRLLETMGASSLVLGPLVARTGIARVAMPGGCAIGGRPIDLQLKALEQMGATITQDHGYLEARADRLKGTHIVFDKITVTGTEDILMAATLADGETILENAAREPEVTDLAPLLIAMGAQIEGAGSSIIKIKGVAKLHGARHRINPDRIEAGTFLIAGAITGGDLNVDACEPAHLGSLIAKLEAAGVRLDVNSDHIRVRSEGASALKAVDISTEEYPGFPTDMQAQFMALATQTEGPSTITENIFENRFMHVNELIRMGANISVSGRTATVRGRTPLQSAAVMCSDLRASAALVLAALVADGETILDRVYHMDRGYERLEEKLRGVGAQIRRMGDVFGKK